MKRNFLVGVFAFAYCVLSAAGVVWAQGTEHQLKYKFTPGQTMRWNVEHLKNIRTTVQGTTQTVEMTTRSVKVWKVTDVAADGAVTLENMVESVDMVQKQSGRAEVRYNSQTDETVPQGFEAFADSIDKTLSVVKLDAQGKVVSRESKWPGAANSQAQLTVPLPAEPIAVGHVWHLPNEISVTLKSGVVNKIKTRQRFALSEVKDSIATIDVETQLLTPVQDPETLVHLIDLKTRGKVHFDIAEGRVVDQQLDSDDDVIGFSGNGSHMRSVSRFSEKWLSPAAQTAAKPPVVKAVKQ